MACHRAPRESAAAPATVAPIHVEFAGCEVVERGPRCRLKEARRLTLWAAAPGELSTMTAAGPAKVLSSEAIEGGVRYTFELPAQAKELVVRSGGGGVALRLPIVEPDTFPELSEARRLRGTGELASARATLEAVIAKLQGPGDVPHLLDVRALLVRIAMDEGHDEQAVVEFRASLKRSLEHGRISSAMLDAAGLAFMLSRVLSRHAEAREVLDQVRGAVEEDPGSRANLPYNDGLVAQGSGDFRTALGKFREAGRRFARLGMDEYAQYAQEQEAITLAVLGRRAEAVAVQRRVVQNYANSEPCNVADRAESVVWFALSDEPSPQSELGKLAREYSRLAGLALERCTTARYHRNHLVNAALLALQENALDWAGELLRQLASVEGGQAPDLEPIEREVAGRYALARGDLVRARSAFEAERDLARKHGLWENEYLAWLGLARSYPLQKELALARYREAERLVDEVLERVPISEGPSGFQQARSAASREMVELLLELGRPGEALATARRARARVLAAAARATRLERLDPERRARWESAVADYKRQRAEYEALQAESWRLPADRLPALQMRLRAARQLAHAQLDAAQAALGETTGPALEAERPRGTSQSDVSPALGETADPALVRRPPSDTSPSGVPALEAERPRAATGVGAGLAGDAERQRDTSQRASSAKVLANKALRPAGSEETSAGADDVLLAYFPGTSGLHAFVQRRELTRAFALPALDSSASAAELSGTLLAPLAEQLRGARRIRVILPNDLAALDFHALELDGEPLLQTFEVVYELDVPARVDAGATQGPRDLIVADPDQTLPGSEREGQSVHLQLGAASFWSGAAAKRDKVLAALPGLRRFHYAGHARYAGLDGIDSSLLLADGELSVGEILTLGAGPGFVVLSACEAARGSGTGVVEGMGLAQAFIVAGARVVLGSPRPTADVSGPEFFELYYRELGDSPAQDAAIAAWRATALQLRERGRPDWAVFRVLVP